MVEECIIDNFDNFDNFDAYIANLANSVKNHNTTDKTVFQLWCSIYEKLRGREERKICIQQKEVIVSKIGDYLFLTIPGKFRRQLKDCPKAILEHILKQL